MVTLTDTPAQTGARDQAARLREIVAQRSRDGVAPTTPTPAPVVTAAPAARRPAPARVPPAPAPIGVRSRACPLIAVASGKGGVGKTTVAANLSIALADAGLRMTLVDADLGMANADLVLGVAAPRLLGPGSLGADATLRSLSVRAPSGVRLIPGSTGIASMADLGLEQRRRLVAGMLDLTRDADALIVDTSAGASRTTLGFIAAADSVLLIATPDPASIADAYATVKCLAHNAATRAEASGADAPSAVSEQLRRIGLLINMADSEREATGTAERLCSVTRRYLGDAPQRIGWLPRDPRLARSVRDGQPLLARTGRGRAARSFRGVAEITRELVERWHQRRADMAPESFGAEPSDAPHRNAGEKR